MSEQKSYPHLAFRHPGDQAMTTAVADELHAIVTRAARPIRPGESVKAQMNRAWLNLGRPPMWRLKSAWWRDGSGHWSAAAVRDFQARYLAMVETHSRRAAAAEATAAMIAQAVEPDHVQLARAEYQDLLRRIAALEALARL